MNRARSEEDRRVVLLSLSEKGEKAFYHHKKFHDDMIKAVTEDLDGDEIEALTRALNKLRKFFRQYQK